MFFGDVIDKISRLFGCLSKLTVHKVSVLESESDNSSNVETSILHCEAGSGGGFLKLTTERIMKILEKRRTYTRAFETWELSLRRLLSASRHIKRKNQGWRKKVMGSTMWGAMFRAGSRGRFRSERDGCSENRKRWDSVFLLFCCIFCWSYDDGATLVWRACIRRDQKGTGLEMEVLSW